MLKEPRVQLKLGLNRTKGNTDLGADDAAAEYQSFMRCRSGKARWQTKTKGRVGQQPQPRPGGASGSVCTRVGLLTEFAASVSGATRSGRLGGAPAGAAWAAVRLLAGVGNFFLVLHRALPDLQRMKLCYSAAASSAPRSVFSWCD